MYSDRPGVIGNTRTPIDFPNALGLETLCLTREEFDILIDRYIEYIRSIDICRLSIPQDIRDAVFSCTGGYPSLVRETLKSLYGHFRRNCSRTDDMLHHLVSKKYFFAINSLRVFDAIVKLEMTDANITFLRDAYHSINNDSTFAVDPANDVIDGLKRSGLITETSSGALMQFAAPLVRVVLGRKLFTARMSLRSQSPSRSDTELDAFIMLSIERMRQSTLQHSLSHNGTTNARLLERQWQPAWLTAASTALPSKGFISPDVGPVFGSRGYLEFYIDGDLRWGFEIMREGSRMAEHVDRFSPSGRYTRIPCSQWRIIDFRHHSKSPGELEENVFYALYST